MATGIEWIIARTTQSPQQYARRVTPLLWACELEAVSGALFDNRAEFILPSRTMDDAAVLLFMASSQRLLDAKHNAAQYNA